MLLDVKALRRYGMIPTRADRCCHVNLENWAQNTIIHQHWTKDVHTELRERSEIQAAFEKHWIPLKAAQQQETLFVVFFFLEQEETKWNNAS